MATKTQGTIFSIETALATTKAITGASAAKPGIITASGHAYTTGDIVKISDVGGMVQLNNRAFVVDLTAVSASPQTNKFSIRVDSSAYTAYTSGGNSYKATMTAVGTVTGMPNVFTGTAPTVKTTHLLSVAEESIMGLQTFGTVSLDLILDNADAGQAAMMAAKEAGTAKCFSIKLTDGKISAFVGYVTSFNLAIAQNEAVRATSEILLASAPAFFG